MPSVAEGAGSSELNADLRAGIDALSRSQEVVFTLYRRVVLPLDGFLFWVKADVLGPSAAPNDFEGNQVFPNRAPRIIVPARTLRAKGSLHFASEARQVEDEGYANNRVVFTTATEVVSLDSPPANTMWIADFEGLRVAFSATKNFYNAAGIWHYLGDAVNPSALTQIVDDPRAFNGTKVVSNSLPFWLAFATRPNPIWMPARQMFPFYPSFAIPRNAPAPYAAVHVDPARTRALQSVAVVDRRNSTAQLASDNVRLTLFGVRNDAALDLLRAILDRMENYDEVGLMSGMPIVRDEKRTQVEINALAQKKTVEFEVSYDQRRIQNVARQLILSALVAFSVVDTPNQET